MMNSISKYKVLLMLFVSIILLSSCRSKKKSIVQDEQIVDTVQLYNVSFFSIGSGIDYKSLKNFEEIIKSKQLSDSNLVFNKYPWGREGEVDYCLDVNKLSFSQKKELEDSIRMLLSTAENARLNINKPCRKAR